MAEAVIKHQAVIRHQIADYLNVSSSSTTEEYALCGVGFDTLDENPNAQIDKKAYINDRSATSVVKGYEAQFPFSTDLMKDQRTVMAIYDIARNQKVGGEAELDYVRVELFEPVSGKDNTFKARKFRVSVEVSSIKGSGAEIIKIDGNFNNVGSFIDGEFSTTTKTFTEGGSETIL